MKRMKNNAGFSLVELIVVIAIMAILAGVGVAGYSIYTEESKKGVDRDTVAEVIRALEMGYNSGELTEAGYVVLGLDGAPSFANKMISSENIENRLKMAFGDDLSDLTLVYDKWNKDYQSSLFAGNETELLAKVETLTGVFSDALNEEMLDALAGGGFLTYVEGLGLDASDEADKPAVGNAAVLFVANKTGVMGETEKANAVNAVNALYVSYKNNGYITHMYALETLRPAFGNSTLSAAAALYAVAESFCRYENEVNRNAAPMTAFNSSMPTLGEGVTNQNEAFEKVFMSFASVLGASTSENIDKYFRQGYAERDTLAYIDVLKTVSSAESQIIDRLDDPNCFTSGDVEDLFNAYSAGGVVIVVTKNDAGLFEITNPIAK